MFFLQEKFPSSTYSIYGSTLTISMHDSRGYWVVGCGLWRFNGHTDLEKALDSTVNLLKWVFSYPNVLVPLSTTLALLSYL